MDLAQVRHDLRYILNEWDPIGVAGVVEDEYDCMLGPLFSMLGNGAGATDISEFLWKELKEHFGLAPVPRDVEAVANRLVAWWAANGPLK